MKEFNLVTLLELARDKFYIFIIFFILALIFSYYFLQNEDYNYVSKKSIFSNNYENAPIIANLNKRITRMNNIQALVNDQFLSLNRISEIHFGKDPTIDNYQLPEFFGAESETIFNNDFVLDQYYKVLTTDNLVYLIKNKLKKNDVVPYEILESINGLSISTEKYFSEGLMFKLNLSHSDYINLDFIDIIFNSIYEYANSSVKQKLVDIYSFYQFNYNQSLDDSINLLKSYLDDFSSLQAKLNEQLLKKIEREIAYAKMIDQEWPFSNDTILEQEFTISYLQGYRMLEKEYERILEQEFTNELFISYEFVLDTLESMIRQIGETSENLEDVLQYEKNIQFMELRTDQTYNIAITRDPYTVYFTIILFSQILAFFISLFLFSLREKR